jgi:protein involved in polysaccharide export with SLBB domain
VKLAQLMRQLLPLAVLILGACATRREAPTSATAFPDIVPDETLGVDDVFDVKVIGEADMSTTYRIDVEGKVAFPYVGRLEVAGLRPGEVQQLLTQRLKDGYLVAPQVLVMVVEWNSRKISVLGQVNKAGPIAYFPKMTIMDAIAAAGGFTPVAAQNSVKLRREGTKPNSATIRVGDISEGRAPNVVLRPRDVLFVEERIF